MKQLTKSILPLLLVLGYSIIAGGSTEDLGPTLGITAAIMAAIGIIIAIFIQIDKGKQRERGMAKAEEQFGDHTQDIEYELGKYILYDEPNHRILLKDSIMDSLKIKELKITQREPRTTVTYKEEQVTKTSSGSAIGRGVVGAIVAGPIGAVVGGATAKTTTETKKTPEYHTRPGHYTIEVIDVDGNSRVKFATSDKSKHEEVRMFLQSIIDINTMDERFAIEQAKLDEHARLMSSDTGAIIIGINAENIKDILIGSTIVQDNGSDAYQLCTEAVGLINKGWNANFERVLIGIKNNAIHRLRCVSNPYSVVSFKNMQLDMRTLADRLTSLYGEPQINSCEVSYTNLTDDNNRISAYAWSKEVLERHRIDYICDKGKYKFELLSEVIAE